MMNYYPSLTSYAFTFFFTTTILLLQLIPDTLQELLTAVQAQQETVAPLISITTPTTTATPPSTTTIPKPPQCGISPQNFSRLDMVSANSRLVGGKEANPHAWPWTGQLITSEHHHCGASLIHPEFMLTAAHCFGRSKNPRNYRVMLGGHAIYSGIMHEIMNISVHPAYQVRDSAFDIALLRIHPPADISSPDIATICLPSLPAIPQQMCVVTGWGRLQENGERAKELQEIHVPIIHPVTCNNPRHYGGRVHPGSMLCAGFNTGRVDSCQGDSGGPLQCQNAHGAWELQGVVSWGIGCAKPDYPGVYSRVWAMAPWVRAQMRVLDPHAVLTGV